MARPPTRPLRPWPLWRMRLLPPLLLLLPLLLLSLHAGDGGVVAALPRGAASVHCGANFTCVHMMPPGRELRCFGYNVWGTLGVGDTVTRGDEPGEMAGNLTDVDVVGVGESVVRLNKSTSGAAALHMCMGVGMYDSGGKCWGRNSNGQLGQGDTSARGDQAGEMGTSLPEIFFGFGQKSVPEKGENFLEKGHWNQRPPGRKALHDKEAHGGITFEAQNTELVDLLVTGRAHTCTITAPFKSVKCWGANGFGQVGLGVTVDVGDDPAEMDGLPNVDVANSNPCTALIAGSDFTCGIFDDPVVPGVYCWGRNNAGQLGQGDTMDRGQNGSELAGMLPVNLPGPGTIEDNFYPVQLAAGFEHACALTVNGSLFCWGLNDFGQLGHEDTDNVGDEESEMGMHLQPTRVVSSAQAKVGVVVAGVRCGGHHCCAVLSDASLKCWGRNDFGQLGLGDTANRGDHPEEMAIALPTVDLGRGFSVRDETSFDLGAMHTCAILNDTSLKCFGSATNGEIGSGGIQPIGDDAAETGDDMPRVQLGGVDTPQPTPAPTVGPTMAPTPSPTLQPRPPLMDLTAGYAFVCAHQTAPNDAVRCWGDNGWGQLGVGDTADRGNAPFEMGPALDLVDLGYGRTAQTLPASSRGEHTCAILDGGKELKCWGDNGWGQLGYGDGNTRGDDAGEMGEALPVVNLGSDGVGDGSLTQVSRSEVHTCVLFGNGKVKCFGANGAGEVGIGSQLFIVGNNASHMGDALPFVDLGTGRTAVQVTAGGGAESGHTCAVLDNGWLKCWGSNSNGELGLGDTEIRGYLPTHMGDNLTAVNLGPGRSAVQVALGDGFTCAVLDDATVKCFGRNSLGQLGLGDTAARGGNPFDMGENLSTVEVLSGAELSAGKSVASVSCGRRHTCALLAPSGSVKCWGYGLYGQLGQGDSQTRGSGQEEMGTNLSVVDLGPSSVHATKVAALASGTCVLLNDSTIKCWGRNNAGQLGQGDTDSRGDDPLEMGVHLPTVDVGPFESVAPTLTPTLTPSMSKLPSTRPSPTPTVSPTLSPSESPSVSPSRSPSRRPSRSPTGFPTASPTVPPTSSPTASPTASPTNLPTLLPTKTPTAPPSASPTRRPTAFPTTGPSDAPSALPSAAPTAAPSAPPTSSPTAPPTASPTTLPTLLPTNTPTTPPTPQPSSSPSASPSNSPSAAPSAFPSMSPTETPTLYPSTSPSMAPSFSGCGGVGWRSVSLAGNETCLKLFREKMTWAEASTECQSNNGWLAQFKTLPAYFELARISKSKFDIGRTTSRFWLGAQRRANESSFVWHISGPMGGQEVPRGKSRFPMWCGGFPPPTEHVATCPQFVDCGGLIGVTACTSQRHFVCQRNLEQEILND